MEGDRAINRWNQWRGRRRFLAVCTRVIDVGRKNVSVLPPGARTAEREGRRGLAGCCWAEAVRARREKRGEGNGLAQVSGRLVQASFGLSTIFFSFSKHKTNTTFE